MEIVTILLQLSYDGDSYCTAEIEDAIGDVIGAAIGDTCLYCGITMQVIRVVAAVYRTCSVHNNTVDNTAVRFAP